MSSNQAPDELEPDEDGTATGLAAVRTCSPVVAGVAGGAVVAVVVVTPTVVVEEAKAMGFKSTVVVVAGENGVENGSTTMVVTVMGMVSPVTGGPVVTSGVVGYGSNGTTTGNVGSVVLVDGSSVITVVDVVVTTVVVVVSGDEVEVTWATPDRAGPSMESTSISTATPQRHSAVVFMTDPGYRRRALVGMGFSPSVPAARAAGWRHPSRRL